MSDNNTNKDMQDLNGKFGTGKPSLSYKEAETAYQNAFDRIEEIKEQLGALPRETSKEAYDKLKVELRDQYQKVSKYAKLMEAAYNAENGTADENQMADDSSKDMQLPAVGKVEGSVFESDNNNSNEEVINDTEATDVADEQVDDSSKDKQLPAVIDNTSQLPAVGKVDESVIESDNNNSNEDVINDTEATDVSDEQVDDSSKDKQLPAVIDNTPQLPAVGKVDGSVMGSDNNNSNKDVINDTEATDVSDEQTDDSSKDKQLPAVIDNTSQLPAVGKVDGSVIESDNNNSNEEVINDTEATDVADEQVDDSSKDKQLPAVGKFDESVMGSDNNNSNKGIIIDTEATVDEQTDDSSKDKQLPAVGKVEGSVMGSDNNNSNKGIIIDTEATDVSDEQVDDSSKDMQLPAVGKVEGSVMGSDNNNSNKGIIIDTEATDVSDEQTDDSSKDMQLPAVGKVEGSVMGSDNNNSNKGIIIDTEATDVSDEQADNSSKDKQLPTEAIKQSSFSDEYKEDLDSTKRSSTGNKIVRPTPVEGSLNSIGAQEVTESGVNLDGRKPQNDVGAQNNIENSQLEEAIEELKKARESLESVGTFNEKMQALEELLKQTQMLSENLTRNSRSTYYNESIKKIETQLDSITKEIEESYKKITELMVQRNKTISSEPLLSDDKYKENLNNYMSNISQELAHLKDLIERKKDEEQKLKRAQIRGENSPLVSIQILYGNDPKTIKAASQASMEMPQEAINKMKKSASVSAVKIPRPSETSKGNNNKAPLPGPEDMLGVYRKEEKKHNAIPVSAYIVGNGIYASEEMCRKLGLEDLDDRIQIDGREYYRIGQLKKYNHKYENANSQPGKRYMENLYSAGGYTANEVNSKGFANGPGLIDKFTMYNDLDNNGVIYVRKNTLARFNVRQVGNDVRINGATWAPISREDANWIKSRANNSISPYIVEEKGIHFNNQDSVFNQSVRPGPAETIFSNNRNLFGKTGEQESVRKIIINIYVGDNVGEIYAPEAILDLLHYLHDDSPITIDNINYYKIDGNILNVLKGLAESHKNPKFIIEYHKIVKKEHHIYDSDTKPERITLYIDKDDNDQVYADEWTMNYLDLIRKLNDKSTTDIFGKKCYKIGKDIHDRIKLLAKNTNIKIEYKNVALGKTNKKSKGTHIYDSDTKPERITLYIDIDDNDQVYADEWTMNYLDLIKKLNDKSTTDIFGKKCYKIGKDIRDRIELLAKNTNIKIEYKNVALGKTNKKSKDASSVKEIINKLVAGLDLKDKDAAKKANRDAYVSKGFLDDLNQSNVLFNIISSVPASYKVIVRGFKKLTGNFATKRGREETEKLGSRINALTKEELEVLFNDFSSTLAESQTNHIDAMLVPKIRQYGVAKAKQLTDLIEKDYLSYLDNQARVNKIGEELRRASIDAQEINRLETERSGLLTKSADCVKRILKNRDLINNIFKKGIDGLEDDVKNSSSRFNYQCIKFADQRVYDKEIAPSILAFQKVLKDGLKNNDSDKIVTGFSELEKVVYDNMYDRNNRNKDKSELGRRVVSYYDSQEDAAEYAVNQDEKGPVKRKRL